MEEAWKEWSSPPQTTQLRALLLIHMWGIWLARNRVIFLEKATSPEEVAKKGLDILSYFPQTKNNPSPRIIVLEQLNKNIPWAFFDGASQNLTCRGGATLFMNPNHHFQMSMRLGSGTNNYVELMTLKLLLCFAIERNCKKVQVFGDSMVVINWINKTQRCKNYSLDTLYEEVNRNLSNFESISFKHVYWERNMDTNKLSKAGLNLQWGSWKIMEIKDTEA